MGLSYNEIEAYMVKIFTGVEYVYIDNIFFMFKFPSNYIKQKAQLIYDTSFKEAISKGMLSIADLEVIMEQRNIITDEEKLKLKKYYSQLLAQKVLLSKTTRVKANKDRIKGAISRIEGEIFKIESKKNSKNVLSANNKAEEDRVFYMCSRCTYKENGDLYWPMYKDALKETEIVFKDNILVYFLRFYSGNDTRVIREIARSSLWRIRYINSIKTSEPLIGIPTSDYTTDQLNLVYWSNYYQNIYDMLPEDRPSDLVIEDDDELDAFMSAYYEERTREDSIKKSKTKRSGKLSAFDSEEVIVTRSHELYQEINYDKPKEATKLKNRVDVRKRTKRG